MKGRARVYIWSGEEAVFAPGVAEKLTGSTNIQNQKIVLARQVSPTSIELEMEMDIPFDESDLQGISVQGEGEG